MSGNASEWCSDWYDEKYYQDFVKGYADNPKGPSARSSWVTRGGSFSSNPSDARIANRSWSSSGYRGEIVGFRLASGVNRSSGK